MDTMLNQITKKLEEHYGEGFDIKPVTVDKINNTSANGVSIRKSYEKISPVIYFDHLIRSDKGVDDIVNFVIDTYGKTDARKDIIVNIDITNYDNIKSQLFFKLINAETNEKYLKDAVYYSFLDLALVTYIQYDTYDIDTAATVKVTKDIIKTWDKTEFEVLNEAYINTFYIDKEYIFESLFDVFKAKGYDLGEDDGLLYLLSNNKGYNGAVKIYDCHIMNSISDKFGCDLIVIPSSCHEVLISPLNYSEKYIPDAISDINAMIKEINETVVSDSDFLSNHAYIYRQDHTWDIV